MASNRSKTAAKAQNRPVRKAPTFEMARALCPHQGVAENVAQTFGLKDAAERRAARASAAAGALQGALGSAGTRVGEISYLSCSDDHLLRHTVFVGLREDEPATEVRRTG